MIRAGVERADVLLGFAARLTVDGALAAFLPEGWSSYLGTQVRASWSASVWIDGTVRDTLLVNCFGALGMACAVRRPHPLPRGGAANLTGSPAADAELTGASLRLVALHDAGGGGGDLVAVAGATASAASGSAWLALPEPETGAEAAAAALVLAALSTARPVRRRGRARC